MKMSLKHVYIIITVLILLMAVFFVLGAVWSGWLYLVAMSLTVAMLLLWGLEWRCPKCGKHLGRVQKHKYCPHCANPLELIF